MSNVGTYFKIDLRRGCLFQKGDEKQKEKLMRTKQNTI